MDDPDGLAESALNNVPAAIRNDPIWRLPAYRFALYLGDQLKAATPMMRRKHSRRTIEQLLDAVRSISANIAEGYSRTSGPDRAKFYEYANSSSYESRQWLFEVRDAFDPVVADAHMSIVNRIIAILTAVIPRERSFRNTRARQEEERRKKKMSDAATGTTDVDPDIPPPP